MNCDKCVKTYKPVYYARSIGLENQGEKTTVLFVPSTLYSRLRFIFTKRTQKSTSGTPELIRQISSRSGFRWQICFSQISIKFRSKVCFFFHSYDRHWTRLAKAIKQFIEGLLSIYLLGFGPSGVRRLADAKKSQRSIVASNSWEQSPCYTKLAP